MLTTQRWTLELRCTSDKTCNVTLPAFVKDIIDVQTKVTALKLSWKEVDSENETISTKKAFVGWSWGQSKVTAYHVSLTRYIGKE
jgi:hypothetical protein